MQNKDWKNQFCSCHPHIQFKNQEEKDFHLSSHKTIDGMPRETGYVTLRIALNGMLFTVAEVQGSTMHFVSKGYVRRADAEKELKNLTFKYLTTHRNFQMPEEKSVVLRVV